MRKADLLCLCHCILEVVESASSFRALLSFSNARHQTLLPSRSLHTRYSHGVVFAPSPKSLPSASQTVLAYYSNSLARQVPRAPPSYCSPLLLSFLLLALTPPRTVLPRYHPAPVRVSSGHTTPHHTTVTSSYPDQGAALSKTSSILVPDRVACDPCRKQE